MTEQVERDGYDQFWDVVESAPVHHGHIVQPIDALRSAWLVRDLTEDDFRAARTATAAMQKDAAMDRLVAEGQRCDAMTPQEAAKVLLDAVDAFMSGEKLTEEQRELERAATIAGAFAAAAYDAHIPKSGGEYHALKRAFLLALIDPDHAELDYLRADPSAGQTARDASADLRAISEDSHE